MIRTLVRGACPGLATPMQTGDGLLVRFLPAAPVPLVAFLELCQAARRHSNGTIQISARGSVQVRGLTQASARRFAADVAALDIDICEGVQIIADPLPGDPSTLIDTSPIAAALRPAIAEHSLQPAPKVSVVIDGGGRIGPDALFADIRLRAVAAGEGPKFQLALAGNAESATPLGLVPADEAVSVVADLLARIAALGPDARAADLLSSLTAQSTKTEYRVTRAGDAIGLHALKSGTALGIGLAFGHAQAEALAELALIAKQGGAEWMRPAPGRALLLGPLGQGGVAGTRRTAERLGFVVEASDPRRRIAACPGAPACMHGLIAARVLAAEIAREVALPAGDGIDLHVSGCAKGCAHPAPAPLTIVGTGQGCGIVRDGPARAAPTEYVSPGDLIRVLTGEREAVHA
jgi:precorrin-3B synthase